MAAWVAPAIGAAGSVLGGLLGGGKGGGAPVATSRSDSYAPWVSGDVTFAGSGSLFPYPSVAAQLPGFSGGAGDDLARYLPWIVGGIALWLLLRR